MKYFKLNALLFSACAVFFFAGNANAQPSHHHNNNAPVVNHDNGNHKGHHKDKGHKDKDRCDCKGKPGCKCDDHHPAPPVAAPHHNPAPAPHGPAVPPTPPAPVHHGPALPPPAPAPGPAPVVVMNSAHFSALIRRVQNEPWTKDKMNLIRREAQHNYFSCEQVAALLRRVNHDSNRIELAYDLYDRTVDKANWDHVMRSLDLDASRRDLEHRMHNHPNHHR